MERDEADSEQLQKLFGLDHLATRMRRNAESLVVLAGVDTRRQWSSPVPAIDVVRGALGEVEDYERAEITQLDEMSVKGSAVAELTHLIAELLENALNYSPPNRPVEIRGRAHGGGYTLTIADHGVGMPEDELAVANTRLSGHESFTVAPSRYLGHYVVGRQSTRLGLTVSLAPTPTGGTTAIIELGPVVATETAEESAPATPGRRKARRSAEPAAEAPAPAAAEPTATPHEPGKRRSRRHATAEAEAGATTGPGAESEVDGPSWASVPGTAEEPAATAVATDDRTVTAEAAIARTEPETVDAVVGTTTSGYKRRVRGENAPDLNVRAARAGGAKRKKSGAESMRTALSTMQSGMQRSQSEGDEPTEPRVAEER
jgi:hypothetical protein